MIHGSLVRRRPARADRRNEGGNRQGAANTRRMAAKCRSGAAIIARAYKGGGKSDWYLPSKGELNALYTRRAVAGGCPDYGCWSSTEADAGYAWFLDFSSGLQLGGKKDFADGVRPSVRSRRAAHGVR